MGFKFAIGDLSHSFQCQLGETGNRVCIEAAVSWQFVCIANIHAMY